MNDETTTYDPTKMNGTYWPGHGQIRMYKMSQDECREKVGHKWESTGMVLTSNPPQYPEICSVCGAKRTGHPQPPLMYAYENPKDVPQLTFE